MSSPDTYRIRIWDGQNYDRQPNDVIEIEPQTTHIWQDDPRYHSPPLGIDIHPDDAPGTLNVYTSDSVRSPPGYNTHVERGYWDGPMEQGLQYPAGHDRQPFGCEVWGRVMFFVTTDK